MENNLVTNLVDVCRPLVLDSFNGNLAILYYTHIPTIIISLFFGFFVLYKSRDNILSKVFFFLAALLTAWSILDLFTWLSWDTGVQMFSWSLTTIVEPLLFVTSFYFIFVFAKKEDLPLIYKILTLILLLPLIAILPTKFNLYAFNAPECYSLENSIGLNYKYFVEIISSIVIIVFSLVKIKNAEAHFRKQLVVLFLGILFFLLSFFSAVFLGGYLAEKGWEMAGFSFEIYGLFGAVVFMGALVYMIVKFKAFEIKLLGAQALVVSLVILIGSQFAFIENQNPINMILTGLTLILFVIFGYFLIRSVKSEVQRKEELQIMADALAVSNDKLRKLDNAKTEFISIASHQLRTPLTAIKGFVALLLEGSYGNINEEMKSALTNVHIAAERLINLVEDLLNVSRIESGRMEYKKEEQSIGNLLKELESIFDIVAKNKGLSFEVKKVEADLPNVLIDDSKMREVLSNLIDNALKYTERGGVTVRAEYGPTSNYKPQESIEPAKLGQKVEHENSGANGFVRVIVSDTGIGIPATELPYLFSKFSRGKDTSRLHVGGTGLGLFVGKNIVEAHGGHVWAESDGDGLGSRFIVELPAV